MTEKHPEDMTAGELLRWATNGEPYNGVDGNSWTYPTEKIRALVEDVTGEWPSDHEAFSIIADKIDAELADTRNESLRRGAELWAMANGWPDFREGEDFGAWLDRCALPRPRFDDREPVQFEDDTDGLHGVEKFIFTLSGGGGCQMQDADGNMLTVFPGGFAKRPTPEVLGADGLPVVAGETVYPISGDWIGDPLEVASIDRDGSVRVSLPEGKGWTCYLADRLTHTPPDTQERIDEDARKSTLEYWGCGDAGCGHCPAKIEGKIPRDRFDARNCEKAMLLDLLRRQRELDARKGGE